MKFLKQIMYFLRKNSYGSHFQESQRASQGFRPCGDFVGQNPYFNRFHTKSRRKKICVSIITFFFVALSRREFSATVKSCTANEIFFPQTNVMGAPQARKSFQSILWAKNLWLPRQCRSKKKVTSGTRAISSKVYISPTVNSPPPIVTHFFCSSPKHMRHNLFLT